MADVKDLTFEILQKIQAELGEARKRDQEIISRLSMIEDGIARIARNESGNYSDIVHNRHAVDRLVERIERRLELS